MTNEEAHRIIMADADFDFSKISPKSQQTADALCVAVKALEKQIPKEPFYTADDDTCLSFHYECPVCGMRLSKGILKYCGECSQRIDWSEEGEQE